MRFAFVLLISFLSLSLHTLADEDVLRPKGKPAEYYGSVEEDYTFVGLPFAIGIEGGINYNMFNQNITYNPPLTQPLLQNFEKADGISPYFGVFADFSFNKTIGLHIKMQYNQVYYENSGTGLIDGFIFDEFGQLTDIRETSASIDWSNEFSYFNFEPSVRINLTEKLFGLVGVTAQIPISKITQTATLKALEDGFYFVDGTNTSTVEEESDLLTSRFGLNLSLGYKVNISKNILLVPQVHYHLFVKEFAENEFEIPDSSKEFTEQISFVDATDKKLNALRFSLAIWFNL